MQTNLMIIINLLLTPVTGLSLFLKRKNIEIFFSAGLLKLYILFLTWNIPFTKFFMVLLRKFGFVVLPESGIYTLIIVFGCAVFITEIFHINLRINKKNEN